MTSGDGSPHDMYRFEPDVEAEERLMTGAIDVADAPPPYRAVARMLQALREAPDSRELAGESDAVEQIAAAVVLERTARPIRSSRRRSPRVAALAVTAVVVCALPLIGGLASAGALPEPAQNAASAVLGKVGISVPTGDPSNNEPPPASAVPGPPSTVGPSPSAVGSHPGAGAPAPAATKRAPGISSPTAPADGQSHRHDTGAGGTPTDNKDSGASKNDARAHSPSDGSGGGSDHER